jgi:hypothetical protein
MPSKSDTILYLALILSIMFLAYVIYTKLYPTAGAPELIKTATAPSTVTLTLTKTVTTTSAFTSKPGTINVELRATILHLSSTISLSLTNYDYRSYHFVRFELVDAQSKTVVYSLEIDVNLLKGPSSTHFDVSIPKDVLQQGRTYIIALYTDDGFRVATTAGA